MENKRNQLFVYKGSLGFPQRMHLEDIWGKTLETIFQCVRQGPYDLWAITRNQEGFIVKSLILMKNHFFRLPFCKLAASFSTPFILLRYCYLLCAPETHRRKEGPQNDANKFVQFPLALIRFSMWATVLWRAFAHSNGAFGAAAIVPLFYFAVMLCCYKAAASP